MAAKGPKAAEMAKLLAQATALSKPGGIITEALAKLTECYKLATANDAPSPQPKDANGDPAADLKAKLAEWSPAIKTAMAAKGPKAAEMAKLLAQASALAKPGGIITEALAKLTECYELATADAAPEEDLSAVFKQKLQAFRPEFSAALTQARTNNPDLAENLDGLFAQMFDEAKAKDFAKALESLDELMALTKQAAQGPTEDEAGEGEGEEDDIPATNMALWNKTKDKVDADINRLCDWLRKTRKEALLEAADSLAAAMGLFKVDLTSSLMNFDNASNEQRKQMLPRVNTVLENYKKSLLADELLTAAETHPYAPVNAKKPLVAALNQIQKKMATQIGS
jgi:hypothetical protein